MEWRINHQAFRANYNDPLLLLAQEQNTTYPPESNVFQTGSNQTVRLIVNNNSTSQHVRIICSPRLSTFVLVLTLPSPCISMATPCPSCTKALATGTTSPSQTCKTRNVVMCRCCRRADTLCFSMRRIIRACGRFIVTSLGICRRYVEYLLSLLFQLENYGICYLVFIRGVPLWGLTHFGGIGALHEPH